MQSGLRIDYRPGGEVLLLSPGEARPFERIQARQAQVGDRILVLDSSIREPIRLAIAGSRKSRQELAAYHAHVATMRSNTPGNSLAEKARNVLARMRAIDPSVGDEINNISRWLNADVARTSLEGTRQPGAARDWPRFRIFMQAVGVDEVLASLYWKAAVLPARSYRAQEGHLFNQRVVHFVLDPESTGVWKTMQGLWQQVMESVDVIVDVTEKSVGDHNG
jgi:type I site-specific restriction endonuclease